MSYSFSDLNTAQRCLKKYEYSRVRNLQRKKRSTPLTQGTMMHKLLMHGYLQIQMGMPWHHLEDELMNDMFEEGENLLFRDEFVVYEDLLVESEKLVMGHFDINPFSQWTVLHVEEEFIVVINGEEITFTPDLVARDPFSKVWIVDHKSTSNRPQGGVPFASQQSLLYLAGVRALYPEVVGFLFNNIRKKIPVYPRLNKTKNKESGMYHVNDLNRIDTTYEVLSMFIKGVAPELWGHPAHMARLAELRDGPDTFYWTDRVLATDYAMKTIVNETAMVVTGIQRAERKEEFPRTLQEDHGYLSCSNCEFEPLCSAELLGMDTPHVMSDYELRDEKNPYEEDDDGKD